MTTDSLSNFDSPVLYWKDLGWTEWNGSEDEEASIIVINANIGFNVLRLGYQVVFLGWYKSPEEAIEYAVDFSRKTIAHHEIECEKGTDDERFHTNADNES